MSTYDFPGYLSALDMRPFRTLLVEGPTDRKILSRLINSLIELGLVDPDSLVIDCADVIDRTGFGMGVREFVEHIHANATVGVDRFFVLVDREFRGFTIGSPLEDALGGHHSPAENCLWTRGHSIENYMFDPAAIIEYLRHYYPEVVPVSTYPIVIDRFNAALIWCAALTIALHEAKLVGRSNGICRREHWDHRGSRLDVDGIAGELSTRCRVGFDPAHFANRISHWHHELRTASPELARWIAHGHLSYALLWAVVGQTLAALGVDPDVVQQIESGRNENKLRSAANWWNAHGDKNSPDYPRPLLEWLQSNPRSAA